MAIKKDKYINALVYFITECGNDHLGITKLNKLFYYLDFISYRDRQNTVTGEKYVRFPMGPVALNLQKKIIKFAEKDKFIEQKKENSTKFGHRNRYKAVVKADLTVFDEYEQNLLNYLCATFKDWSTDQMIAQTHSEAPWVFSEANKVLDYKNADDIEFFEKDSVCA